MKNKINNLIQKIGTLREKLYKIKLDYDLKASKITDQIKITEEKIFSIRIKNLKDKEVPKALEYYLGIRWIHPDIDGDEELMRATIEKATEPFPCPDEEDELGIEFLE